jgi:peptide/nickel transport system substrate-binding protein
MGGEKEKSMPLLGKRLAVLALVGAAIAALAAASAGSGAGGSKRGGVFKMISAGDVGYIDPGQSYDSLSFQILRPVHRALFTIPGGKLNAVPDLAAGPVKVTNEGRTITVTIRRGVRYSPPVNREVVAADVKYAIERAFSASLANPYVWAYFSVLKGAPSTPPKTPKPISGISTKGKYTIVFKLAKPYGAFVNALVMPVTAPVPKEYAAQYDNKATSDYAFHQVATGPYMLKNDRSGNVKGIGYTPGRQITLVRNPNWNAKTDFRPAYLDGVELREGFTDNTVATRQILSGAADGAGDFAPPPAMIKQILSSSSLKDNMYGWPLGTLWIGLNTQKKPFDNVHVRAAATYALDRSAMRLAVGGPITGRIATHFIGPDFEGKGFEAAGGFNFDPFPSPGFRGSVAKAKAELKKAGYANGTYTGPSVTAVIVNIPTLVNQGKVLAASLAKIGMTVNLKAVTPDAMYTKCGTPKTQPELCPNVGMLPDFKDPVTLLDVTFNGKYIQPAGNVNWSLFNDPKVNAAMERAKRITNPKTRYKAWGRIDRMITLEAAAIPWQWTNTLNLISDRVVASKMLDLQGQPDLAFSSLK